VRIMHHADSSWSQSVRIWWELGIDIWQGVCPRTTS
jgi:hypothetical protein